jgi:hypothetical protein
LAKEAVSDRKQRPALIKREARGCNTLNTRKLGDVGEIGGLT